MLKRCSLLFIVLNVLLLVTAQKSEAQTKKYIAMVPPFHSRLQIGSSESLLQLSHLRFVLFVYSNAVAVYSESEFINQSDNFLEQEIALPSTGHDENGSEPGGRISNGILSIQLWVQDERVVPKFIQDGDEDWYTINTKFSPHEKRIVKALFWAETSLADIDSSFGLDTTVISNGKRGFLIDLAHASVWNNVIQSIDTYVVLKDGISTDQQTFSATPSIYDLKDSTLVWSMKYIEPSFDDNIFVSYDSSKNVEVDQSTIVKLADYIVKEVYDQLLYFVSQLDEF